MRKQMKMILGTLMSAMLLYAVPEVQAATCDIYDGYNKEDQSYAQWSSPVGSYLSACADGTMMRVQAGVSSGAEGILVEYYDKHYEVIKKKVIQEELPIFGAFYESSQYYFILSGQRNSDKLADVECYRVTKYDKNWNRLDSVGLYDCNTTIPFNAGSARMDDNGTYLVIRTSHEMYSGHQANLTMEVNMDTMDITDSVSGVTFNTAGYVSHSFNQFIKLENNKIVAVDHGDAYPRSICLIQYPTDISTGSFNSVDCICTNVVKIPGSMGNNKTGASVGGFEISDSAYLIAGNSVVQDKENTIRETRNIYVAAMSKETSEITMHWLTSYEEGETGVSTPQMVKLANNKYMVLWSRNDKVYYQTIDGNGNTTSDIYSMEGNLSDCVPVRYNGNLIWYVWQNEKMDFYEINVSDISKHNAVNIVNGHIYEVASEVVDGKVLLKCTRCGGTKEQAVCTSYLVYWKDDPDDTVYHSAVKPTREQGDEIDVWVKPRDYSVDNQMVVTSSDENVMSVQKNSDIMFKLVAEKKGTAVITVYPKLNPSLKKTFTYTVKGYMVEDYLSDFGYRVGRDDQSLLMIKNVALNTSISGLFRKMSDANGVVKVFNNAGNQITDTGRTAATGNKVQVIQSGAVVEESYIVIRGDVNGDGAIDVMDMEAVQKHLLGLKVLTGAYYQAARIREAEDISVLDMEGIQKHILGVQPLY